MLLDSMAPPVDIIVAASPIEPRISDQRRPSWSKVMNVMMWLANEHPVTRTFVRRGSGKPSCCMKVTMKFWINETPWACCRI